MTKSAFIPRMALQFDYYHRNISKYPKVKIHCEGALRHESLRPKVSTNRIRNGWKCSKQLILHLIWGNVNFRSEIPNNLCTICGTNWFLHLISRFSNVVFVIDTFRCILQCSKVVFVHSKHFVVMTALDTCIVDFGAVRLTAIWKAIGIFMDIAYKKCIVIALNG